MRKRQVKKWTIPFYSLVMGNHYNLACWSKLKQYFPFYLSENVTIVDWDKVDKYLKNTGNRRLSI